jgi:hypothetical protein
MLGDAQCDDGHAVWHQAFSRVNPEAVTVDYGYCDGAAGIGAALLQLYAVENNTFRTIRLPDDPFKAAL